MNITKLLNKAYFAPRLKEIERYATCPGDLQEQVLRRLLRLAGDTEWGRKHDYAGIRTYDDFRRRLLSVMSRLTTDEWALLERMAWKLVDELQQEQTGQEEDPSGGEEGKKNPGPP